MEAENFDGFQRTEYGASIMVQSFPAPLDEIRKIFDQPSLLKLGMTKLSREELTHSGLTGSLLHLSQNAGGIEFQKWAIVLSDGKTTWLATAIFPAELADELSEEMKKTALSIRPAGSTEPTSPESLNFNIEPSGTFVHSQVWIKQLALTETPFVMGEKNLGPIFLGGHSIRSPLMDLPKDFARYRFHHIPVLENHSIEFIEPIVVDGLEGFEVWGSGTKTATGQETLLYLVILNEENSYYIFTGMAELDSKDQYLADFQSMARSFTH